MGRCGSVGEVVSECEAVGWLIQRSMDIEKMWFPEIRIHRKALADE